MHAPIPTPADVARTGTVTDMPRRNMEVTTGYYLFSQEFRKHLGEDATWPTFATWASAQAGRTIRKEDLLRTLERRLGDSEAVRRLVEGPMRMSAKFLLESVLQVNPFARSSDAVARGNIKVYTEIGAHFARYLRFLEKGRLDDAGFDDFLDEMSPGPPPDGQDYLKLAFTAYRHAMKLPHGRERSQLIFYGNLCIGVHEQTRLQPEIEDAIAGSFWDGVEVKDRLIDILLPRLSLLQKGLSFAAHKADAVPLLQPLINEIRRLVREIITETMMVLELPGETLRLGRDLGGRICESLSPIEHPEAIALVRQVDTTPDTLQGSGTDDWSSLPQRMHFIADLFRSRQDYTRLFEAVPQLEAR